MNTCETRKISVKAGDGNDNVDGDGSDGDVIVLNPVNDSACNLQCAVGWYHSQHGNKAPFSCAPETKNRTLSEGIPTDPVTCSSACVMTSACMVQLFSAVFGGYNGCRRLRSSSLAVLQVNHHRS